MHHILSAANERGVFVQFHAGLLEGNRRMLSNSNPELLENLFLKYPGVKFDLFHIGYPYWGVTAAFAKTYTNVFIDRLRWGVCTLFEVRPESIRLAELHPMYSLFTSLVGLCNMFLQEPTTALLGLFQGSGLCSSQRLTPSATAWPSSLKGGLKIRIIRSQMQHILPREKKHNMIPI